MLLIADYVGLKANSIAAVIVPDDMVDMDGASGKIRGFGRFSYT